MSEGLKAEGRDLTFHIPNEIECHRADIKRIVDAMIYKLHRNAHKGRWADIDLVKGVTKLRQEVGELEEAINNGNMMEIISEAADVANWALILANVAIDRKDV